MNDREAPSSIRAARRGNRFLGMLCRTAAAAWFALLALGLLGVVAPAFAAGDPPSRAGRLAEVSGKVWLYQRDGNEWIEAGRNRPITQGDRLSTERDSRAEIRIGTTTLRLDEDTEVEFQALDDDDAVRVRLQQGGLAARLRTGEAARAFSVLTVEGAAQPQVAGGYRVDRRDDRTELTVSTGQARMEGEGTSQMVLTGQRGEFWRDGGALDYALGEPQRDRFADWVAAQDHQDGFDVPRTASARYVSPEMTGAEDLDRYGRWETSSDYGPVWYPSVVAAGWAPYRVGHWAWVSPWGWTWVDDAPWGFAPFHYGRWVWYRDRWGWTPGTYVARPVYAPALVAWVGGGGGGASLSVSIGGPPVGWFPLAPREVYVPSYHFSETYIRRVNVTQVTQINNITTIVNNPQRATAGWHYANRGPQGLTAVPPEVLYRREPVRPSMVGVTSTAWRDLQRGQPRFDPPVVRPAPQPTAFRPAPPDARPDARPGERPGDGRGGWRDDGRGNGQADGRWPGRPDSDRRDAPGRPSVGHPPAATAVPAQPDRSRWSSRDEDAGWGRAPDRARGQGNDPRMSPPDRRPAPQKDVSPGFAPAQPEPRRNNPGSPPNDIPRYTPPVPGGTPRENPRVPGERDLRQRGGDWRGAPEQSRRDEPRTSAPREMATAPLQRPAPAVHQAQPQMRMERLPMAGGERGEPPAHRERPRPREERGGER